MLEGEKLKKAVSITGKVISWLIVAVAVAMMVFTVISVTVFDRDDRSILGIRMYIVKTDSMSSNMACRECGTVRTDEEKIGDWKCTCGAKNNGYFNAGDLIFAKSVDVKKLEAGDIITFQSADTDSLGETITHMIREVKEDASGNRAFVTYGTTTGSNDETLVGGSAVYGKYIGKVPGAGHFFSFLKTTPGYVCCILIPFLLLIIYHGISCVKIFKKYKAEQVAEMEEERKKLEEERLASLKMMEELQALKAQLGQQNGENKIDNSTEAQ